MIKCDICKMNSANYLVVISSAPSNYPFKRTYRCEVCKERSEKSYLINELEIKNLY